MKAVLGRKVKALVVDVVVVLYPNVKQLYDAVVVGVR